MVNVLDVEGYVGLYVPMIIYFVINKGVNIGSRY